MLIVKAEDLDTILDWLRTCPCEYTVSSMQGGNVHVKFQLDCVNIEKVKADATTA
jgi:hypothetical protein